MPTDHDPDPADLGDPDIEDLLDLWEWVRAYRSASGERVQHLVALLDEARLGGNPGLAGHLDSLAALADQEHRQLDASLEPYLRRSVPPWAIWERAFGWRPGQRQIRAFLRRARKEHLEVFPLADLAERSRHVLGGAVEHTYQYLDGGEGWDAVVEWTRLAAVLHIPKLETAAWPERVEMILGYREIQQSLDGGKGAPARRGPKLAACRAVSLLAGPSWRACEEAHKTAKETMAEWAAPSAAADAEGVADD